MWVLALVVFGSAAVLLLTPVHVEVEWSGALEQGGGQVRVRGRWAFVRWQAADGSGRRTRARTVRPSSPRIERRQQSPERSARRALALLRSPGFVARSVRLVLDLGRVALPRQIDGWLRFGFDDPASTGEVLGAAAALTAVPRPAGWRLHLEPDFSGPALAGDARMEWFLRPAALLWPVGRYLASPITWRAVAAAARQQ